MKKKYNASLTKSEYLLFLYNEDNELLILRNISEKQLFAYIEKYHKAMKLPKDHFMKIWNFELGKYIFINAFNDNHEIVDIERFKLRMKINSINGFLMSKLRTEHSMYNIREV